MKSTYRLAGHTIKIESLYSQVLTLCAAYRVEDDAEYCITTAPADIAYERQRSARADELEGAAVREPADPYLETLAVYRKLAQLLVQDDILLMHGAVVAVDGQAYLFTAKSGTGKTTHTRSVSYTHLDVYKRQVRGRVCKSERNNRRVACRGLH